LSLVTGTGGLAASEELLDVRGAQNVRGQPQLVEEGLFALAQGRIRESLVYGGGKRGNRPIVFDVLPGALWLAAQSVSLGSSGGDMPALRLGVGTGGQVANCESRGLTNRHFGAQP
jgi:hypothetical protein